MRPFTAAHSHRALLSLRPHSSTWCALTCSLLLTACASQPGNRQGPAQISTPTGEAVGSATAEPEPAPVPTAVPSGEQARSTLLAQAREAQDSGNGAAAIALLERALRLDPTDGGLYLELARAQAGTGRMDRARATAERGLLYCSGEDCRALERLLRELPPRRG
jgi:Tfp pilus assembly protein PilF